MTILKALKDRIRSMGGETNATNIADAIKDLPKGGSSELPPEVTNAVETHGMGWTDEDETVHQIDEKYIPSSGGSTYYFEFDRSSNTEDGSGVETDADVAEILQKIKNKEAVVFIVKDYDSGHSDWEFVALYQISTFIVIGVDNEVVLQFECGDNYIIGGSIVDGESQWIIELADSM